MAMAQTAVEQQAPAGAEAEDRAGSHRTGALLRWGLPVLFGLIILGGWELFVWYRINVDGISHYNHILPAPTTIAVALVEDWHILAPGWLVTLWITAQALFWAVVLGVGLAIAFSLSKWIEYSFFPYAVVLQVTPIVAIAPLIITMLNDLDTALLVCAWIVAFFPILSNTTLGLVSTDRNLLDLFRLYGAGRFRTLVWLRFPAALPYFLGGLRIAGGLCLIGAVVAEFAAGTAGSGSGLAYRILEAGYRLNVPRMYAALVMIAGVGILIFLALTALNHLFLRRWHESARAGE